MKFSERVDRAMELTPDEITARLRDIEMTERALSAEKAALMSVAEAVNVPAMDGHASTMGWIVANTNCSKGDAIRARKVARMMNHVEEIADALSVGSIGMSQANELARAFAKKQGGSRLRDVGATMAHSAEHLDFDALRTCLERWEQHVDPDGALKEVEYSEAGRSAHVVEVAGAVDVRATGGGPLETEEMITIFHRYVQAEWKIDAEQARRAGGPKCPVSKFARTADQRRFDALLAIFRDAVMTPTDGVRAEPVVNIVVSQDNFEAGLARRRLFDELGVTPALPITAQRCETSSGRVIPLDTVITAALTGRVRRIITDTTGRVTDYGRSRRLFSKAAREAAALLPTSCSWAGCFVPAELCQTDHLAEWERDDGGTDLANAAPECERHNRFKSAKRISSTPTAIGTIVHTKPDGTMMLPAGASLPPMPDPDIDHDPPDREPATLFDPTAESVSPVQRLAELDHAVGRIS